MSKFQLYIDNQKVDLFSDESVSLTETIQNIRDVSKVFTDFTKPFSLPASETNNKIFKHYYRFNLSQGYTFDARKKIDARIELNTIPYREGKIVLEGVDLDNLKPKSYRVTFFGNTVNLKDLLGDDELSGLSWLNNFNTTYSAAEIRNTVINSNGKTITADSVQYTAALIAPLITNTQRLYYDSSTAVPYTNSDGTDNTALGGNLYPTQSDVGPPVTENADDVHGVYFEDLTYAIKTHLIVKAIEEQYDEISFSDDFFSLTNGPDAYKNMYMLLQKKEGRIYDDLTVAEKQIKGFPLLTQNNSMQMNNDALIVFTMNPNQTVLGRYEFQFSGGYPEFTAIIKEGSAEVIRKTFTASSNTTANISQQLDRSTEGYTLHIESQTAFTIDSCAFVGISPSGNSYTSQISSSVSIPLEKEFIVSDNIPPMKVIDFLTGLFKMFNLTAFQQDGIIHVKTLESFYNGGTVRDITEFVDPQTIQVNKALPYREIEFRYEDTGATLANQHKESQGVEWGSAKYVETGNLNSNDQKFEVTAPFAHLKYERINGILTDIQWGFMADEKNEPYFDKPVLFIGEFVNLTNPIRFLNGKTGTSSISDISDYWMPSNFVSRDSTISKEGLHFDLELSEWNSTTAFTETLFDKYYRFYISGIFNSAKRLTKITARLPKRFVINFTLADTLVINSDRYKINSITTDLLSGASQLELLNETVNDATATQTETGGGQGQLNAPLTNVLTLYQCASPNNTFESASTLAVLNLANNARVQDGSGNSYKVTGNNPPNTHTSVAISATGLTDCPSNQTPDATQYYSLTKCSDNTTNYRTSTEVDNPTYAITQQVFDNAVKYVVRNATAEDTVPSVTITSTPSPAQLTCSGNTTAYYYSLNACLTGSATTLYGFSSNSSKTGTVSYQNQTYVIGPSGGNTGTIDIDSLNTSACVTYYYAMIECGQSAITFYGYSASSTRNNTRLEYNGTCYIIQNTTNQVAAIDLDTLSACSCTSITYYYLLRDCDTVTTVRTATTTTDIPSLTVSSTVSSASRVQDASTGKCYTVTGTTSNTVLYPNPIGQITDLGVLGCPATPCSNVLYYQLEQCSTGNTGYISTQDTTQISLSVNDIVATGSLSGPRYKVLGTTGSGIQVGTVYLTPDSACPTFYELTQCYTNQTGYRTNQSTSGTGSISLSVGDRVTDPCGMPYTVTTVGVSGGSFTNVGDVTDTGQTGCPTVTGSTQYWSMDRCSDGTTGYLSSQTTSDVTFNANDTVTVGSTRYQIVGAATLSSGTTVGVACADGGNNCLTPVSPPQPPAATIYYARFVSCDDPTGAIIAVYSTIAIGTFWVIQEVNGTECYRWLDNTQGVNPTELNSSNFNFFTEESTAGANCLDCQATVPTPPPPVGPPPATSCHTVSLYQGSYVIDLCSGLPAPAYLNASTLAAASQVYTDNTCSTLLGSDRYFAEYQGGNYYYWNSSAQTLTGPFTTNCP
jgi:hypothetical protein